MKRLAILVAALSILAGGISDGSWAASKHVNDSCPFLGATHVWTYYNTGGHAYYTQSTCQMNYLGLWREWGPVYVVYIY